MMAKASVKLVCKECGNEFCREKNGFRNRSEADSWEEWAKANIDLCPECWHNAQVEAMKKDETPVTIKVTAPASNCTGHLHLVLVANGGTYREKENLKAAGYTFGDAPCGGGFADMFSARAPSRAWHKIIECQASDFSSAEALDKVVGAVDGKIDGYTAEFKIGVMDFALLEDGIKKAAEEEAKKALEAERKAKVGDSPIQQFVKANGGGYWNGKKYGSDKYGYRVYIDNTEYKLPADVMDAQSAWYAHRDEVNAEYEAKKNTPVAEEKPTEEPVAEEPAKERAVYDKPVKVVKPADDDLIEDPVVPDYGNDVENAINAVKPRYDRSHIFKMAWQLRRSLHWDMSKALKAAWSTAKKDI
jgi:hypothetical protein